MSRRVVLLVAGAVFALAAGLAGPDAAGAQPEPTPVEATLTYQCDSSTVTLAVRATMPAQAAAHVPIKPADVTLTLTVPPDAVAPLTAAGAVDATAVIRMDTTIIQGETTASANWGAAQDAPVPLADSTVFTGAVTAEPVTAAAGELSFAAGPLVAAVTGLTADGAATDPPSVTLTCVPAPDQDLVFAVVPVVVPTRGDAPSATEQAPDRGGLTVGGKSAPPTAAAAGPVPPECHPIDPPPGSRAWQNFCANLTGYTNVAKLKTSVLQPVGLVNIAAANPVPNCLAPRIFCQKAHVLPNLNGESQYPPAPGSFYSFGFVPTTGTMQLTQIGPALVDLWFTATLPYQGEATATIALDARISDVEVYGQPLDVGPNCHTAVPINAVLKAKYPSYSITQGGVLQGMVDIPAFDGCGVTEDLDQILTGLVSGPGNYVKMTQGIVCSLSNGVGCPPNKPVPQR